VCALLAMCMSATMLCSVTQVARACAIFLFYPLLSSGRVGYPMTWRTALFMVWAGLRGAVSRWHA
jgi:NhaP-type Na+/H+ or K+/H+ antiporter